MKWKSYFSTVAILVLAMFVFGGCGGGGSGGSGGGDNNAMTIDHEELELIVGETGKLTVQNFEGELQWESSDEEVAEIDVDVNGEATIIARSEGKITIFVSDENGDSASCEIIVTGTLAEIFIVSEDNVLLQNAVINPRVFYVTKADVVSASFKRKSEAHQAIAPYEIVLSGKNFVVGDILVAQPSESWQYGFSAVVETVERNSDGTQKYTLTQAAIEDI